MPLSPELERVRALTFDVFGTVVDWRTGVAGEAEALLGPKGRALDWGAFADAWRARYVPAMAKVSRGERPFVILDELHRENLIEVLTAAGVVGLSEAEIDALNLAWHRLDPWPDVREGMGRLKRRFILASLSNGNVRLIVDMARHAGLPWDAILGAEVAGEIVIYGWAGYDCLDCRKGQCNGHFLRRCRELLEVQ